MAEQEQECLLVTSEQLCRGWMMFVGNTIIRRSFEVVKRRPDGLILVKAPRIDLEEDRPARFPITDAR